MQDPRRDGFSTALFFWFGGFKAPLLGGQIASLLLPFASHHFFQGGSRSPERNIVRFRDLRPAVAFGFRCHDLIKALARREGQRVGHVVRRD